MATTDERADPFPDTASRAPTFRTDAREASDPAEPLARYRLGRALGRVAMGVRRFLAGRQGVLVAGLSAAALVVLVVTPFWWHAPRQGGSAALEAGWVPLPGRRELILDLRKAAAATPAEPFASGAHAHERLESGARLLAAGDHAGALRELDAAEAHLTRALRAADEEPVILAAHGVCALLRDDALTYLGRTSEAAEARETAKREFTAASEREPGAVRAVASWNESLLEERRSLIAMLSGDSSLGGIAQDEAARARERALAAVEPGSALAALLAADSSRR